MATRTNVKNEEKDGVLQNNEIDAWQGVDNTHGSDMKQTLRPILFGMAIAGCYNVMDIRQTNNQLTRTNSLKDVASKIYRLIYFVAIFLFLCKATAACFYISPDFFSFNILLVFWLLFNVTAYIIFLKATSKRYGHIENVFNFWTKEIAPQFEELHIQYPGTKIKRRGIIALTFCITAAFLNVSGGIVYVYMANQDIYVSPFEINSLTLIVAFVFYAASSFIWAMSIAVVVISTMFIKEAFNTTNQYVTALCDDVKNEECRKFDQIRRLHLNLCKLVGDLDRDVSWYYASSFMFNVCSSVFVLYQIIRISMDNVQLTLFWIWLVAQMFAITLPIIHAAVLHDAAHAPLDSIYYINVQDITVEKLAQLNLFLSKLTGTQVGFSTCGLLIITKEFLLTIAGVFLTYFAVLYTL